MFLDTKSKGIKHCKKCNTRKPLSDFYLKGGTRRGHQHMCKICMKSYYKMRWKLFSKEERESRKEKYRNWFNGIKKEIFDHYGRKCKCCNEKHVEFLTIDHINGGGTKHRKQLGGGTAFFRWLRDESFPAGYRTLCINCNFALGRYGYCPHKNIGGD